MVEFSKLGLSKTTLDAISKKGFSVASEIQAKTIPLVLEQQHDVIGIAQTGTGKTAAFGLPIIDMIKGSSKTPQSIILAPTRELALQVTSELQTFCGSKKINILTVYGGTSIQTQIKDLKRGVDIVVGTPGRVVDLLNRKDLNLGDVKYFILDEADEMLKMGFIEDIEFVLSKAPTSRKVYLFSATMPARIKQLSKKYMKNQTIVEVEKKQNVSSLITQSFYKARQSEKFQILQAIIDTTSFFYGIIFCRTKADVEKVTNDLKKTGHKADCIHGDIAQNKRERILKKFKDQHVEILVATDVAARGIDVDSLTHVINFNLPEDVETYTHRIGRTGRAGNAGEAISLVTPSEMRRISQIEKTLKVKLESKRINKQELEKKKFEKTVDEITSMIKKVDTKHHLPLITELLNNHSAEKVIGALLERNKSGGVESSPKSQARGSAGGQERVFIARGKMDKLDARGLIRYVEREIGSKLGDVKDIKICDKFSFMTLDAHEAHAVVDHFESKNPRRPLAEIAQK